jgi:prepilin-type processing-associated H-X9-DG protein
MELHRSNQRNCGLTGFEMLVCILMVVLLVSIVLAMLYPIEAASRQRAEQITCINNLRQLNMASRIWEVIATNGPICTSTSSIAGLNAGQNAWVNFAGSANLLASAKILHCPADKETPMPDSAGFKIKLSYFLNLDGGKTYPRMVLFGDDNLAIGDKMFGDARPAGSMGFPGDADVPMNPGVWEIPTNMPVSWQLDVRHRHHGNLAWADGSVQLASYSGLNGAFEQTGQATNQLAIP